MQSWYQKPTLVPGLSNRQWQLLHEGFTKSNVSKIMSLKSSCVNGEILYHSAHLHVGVFYVELSLVMNMSKLLCFSVYVPWCVQNKHTVLLVVFTTFVSKNPLALSETIDFQKLIFLKVISLSMPKYIKNIYIDSVKYFIYLHQMYKTTIEHKHLRNTGTDCSNSFS